MKENKKKTKFAKVNLSKQPLKFTSIVQLNYNVTLMTYSDVDSTTIAV